MINLAGILSALTNQKLAPLSVPLSRAVIDSRQADEGSLFIALPGEKVDGHVYVADAFQRGAKVALIDRPLAGDFNTLDLTTENFETEQTDFSLPLCLKVDNTLISLQKIAAYWRRQHKLRVIGITGSVGKTSTKELTAAILSKKYAVLKNPGNYNNEIGLPLSVLDLKPTHDCAVLEMGFYVPGEIQTLCDIAQPQVGVVTNIGTVHAERAGSQETIAKGKSELVQSLPPAPKGTAILNWDDPWVRWMAEKTHATVLSYGVHESANLHAKDIQTHGLEGVSCTLAFEGSQYTIHSPLLGAFSVYTILRAAAAALVEGLSWGEIQEGLSTSTVDLRMRHFNISNQITVIDDTYNASPASSTAALELLEGLEGRRVAILGDMLELGIYEEEGHRSVGERAAKAVDVLVLVGKRSKIIGDAALDKGFPPGNLHWFANSENAAKAIHEVIQPNDVVLVKGSNSMRMDKILSTLEVLT